MQDPPPPGSILASVAEWLREAAAPVLPPHRAFEAQVAANALEIVSRGLSAGPAEEEELARLRALLGRDGALEGLTAELAADIREGRIAADAPGLVDHLWTATLAKVAVDQPKFPPYRRLTEGA